MLENVRHLSPSSINALLNDQASWYDKYVNYNFDSKTWTGTVSGSIFHNTVDAWVKSDREVDLYKTAKAFIEDEVHNFNIGKTVFNDKEEYTEETLRDLFMKEVYGLIGTFLEYQKSIDWDQVITSEVSFRSRVGEILLGDDAPSMPIKGKVDLDTTDEVVDWKTVKRYEDKEIDYTIQGVLYGLLKAEHTGKLPRQTRFVEFMRNHTTYADKIATWEADVLAWEAGGKQGTRPRKPAKPRGEEPPAYREIIVPMEEWRIKVVLELVKRIQDLLEGQNILAQGRPLPAVSSKYGRPDGWVLFVEQVAGFNPWTGEIKDTSMLPEDIDISFLD